MSTQQSKNSSEQLEEVLNNPELRHELRKGIITTVMMGVAQKEPLGKTVLALTHKFASNSEDVSELTDFTFIYMEYKPREAVEAIESDEDGEGGEPGEDGNIKDIDPESTRLTEEFIQNLYDGKSYKESMTPAFKEKLGL